MVPFKLYKSSTYDAEASIHRFFSQIWVPETRLYSTSPSPKLVNASTLKYRAKHIRTSSTSLDISNDRETAKQIPYAQFPRLAYLRRIKLQKPASDY